MENICIILSKLIQGMEIIYIRSIFFYKTIFFVPWPTFLNNWKTKMKGLNKIELDYIYKQNEKQNLSN